MQVLFESRDREGLELRELVHRRVQFSMHRLTWLVSRARVQLVDVNGPRGGVDKRCQIELLTGASAPLVLSAVDKDWRSALDRVLSRAVHLLTRLWRRQREHRRVRSLPEPSGD